MDLVLTLYTLLQPAARAPCRDAAAHARSSPVCLVVSPHWGTGRRGCLDGLDGMELLGWTWPSHYYQGAHLCMWGCDVEGVPILIFIMAPDVNGSVELLGVTKRGRCPR